MYDWRCLTPQEQKNVLRARRAARRPWHAPPHFDNDHLCSYIISAACYEHEPIICVSAERMGEFSERLVAIAENHAQKLYGWCVLPNHYHLVVRVQDLSKVLAALGQLHGRTSHDWNGEDNQRGRKVWHGVADRRIRSERHLWASINYVHHNPVKHGYVQRWQDWPWSSAESYLAQTGVEKARQIWQEYPVDKYGDGWDD